MSKRLCLLLLFGILVILISTCNAFAEDNSAFYNNYVYPKAAYKQGIEPSFAMQNANQKSVDPLSGNLDLKITDLFLKGKNGLDFSLTRQYSSSESNLYESSQYWGEAMRYTFNVSYYEIYDYIDNSVKQDYGSVSTSQFIFRTIEEAQAEYNKFISGYFNYHLGPYTDSEGYQYYHDFLYIVSGGISYKSVECYDDATKSLTFREKSSNIGAGWAFDFPQIEKRDSYEYLHLGNSGTWSIDFSYTGGDSHLRGYNLKDMVLDKDEQNIYSNGQMSSSYVLTEKDGKRTFFGSDGRLLGVVDRFGNEIKFQHTMVSMQEYNSRFSTWYTKNIPLITKIIDSVGREINLAYSDTQVTVTVQDKTNAQNNRTIVYNKTLIAGRTGEYFLDNVIDPTGRKTSYYYDVKSAKISFIDKSPGTGYNNDYACLTKIIYPTGAETHFTYAPSIKNCGNEGSMDIYKVTECSDYNKNGSRYNYTKYTYKYENTGEYDGYPGRDSSITETCPVKTKVEDINNYNKVYSYAYVKHPQKNEGNVLCFKVLEQDGTILKKENLNYYDTTTKLITKTVEKLYNGTQYLESVENYSYDNWKNLTGYWDAQAQRDSNKIPVNDEHKTSYTYDTEHYNLLTGKTYKKDSDTTIREEYLLSPDFKTVAFSKVYEKKGTGTESLKGKTGFLYDLCGNVVREKKYLDDGTSDWNTDFVDTGYDYIDSSADSNRDFTGAYITRKYTTNVKDADNNLVSPIPGNEPGTVEECYKYDYFGNIIELQDANGNITTYEYDKLNRKVKETNPEGSYKKWDYVSDLTGNYTISTDENSNSTEYSGWGNKTMYIFDELGNFIDNQVYNQQTGQFVSTMKYTYDANSRLIKEENLINGTTTDYVLCNDGRLQQKSVRETNNGNKLISLENYTYEDAVENGTLAKITKSVTDDVYSQTSITYINVMGKVQRQERLHKTEDGTEKIYKDTFVYDYLGNKTEEKTARAYDEPGIYANCGWTARYEYNYLGKVVEAYNVLGDHTSTEYDALGRVTSVTDSKGNNAQTKYSTTYEYDALGRVLVERIPFESNDIGTCYSIKKHYYDLNGNITREMVSNNKPFTDPITFSKTTYEYNNRNMLTKVTTFNNGNPENYTQYYYDANGNKIRMFTGLNKPLDIYGPDNVMDTGDSEYSTTKYEYNELNKLTKMTDPMGKSETYKYDLNGNLIEKTDRNNSITSFTYDGLNRLLSRSVKTTDGLGNALYSYTYSLAGNKSSMSGGKEILANPSFTQNNNGWGFYTESGVTASRTRDTSVYDSAPAGCKIECTTKGTARGSIQLYTSGTGVKVEAGKKYKLTFRAKSVGGNINPDILLSKATSPYNLYAPAANVIIGNEWTTYSVNFTSNITDTAARIVFALGDRMPNGSILYIDSMSFTEETQYVYDDLGRLISEIGDNGITKEYTYDASNNRKSLVIKQNGNIITNTTYDYDNMNRLWHVYEGGQLLATYTYDANGNRDKLEYTNGNSTEYIYNLANKVTELKNLNGTTELSHFDYTYYLDGNQESKKDVVTNKTSTYTYDGLGRLTSEIEAKGSSTTSTTSYAYDDYNNRKTMNSNVFYLGITNVTNYNYDANNRLITEIKTTNGVDEVTSYGYDDNGNQLTKTVNFVNVLSNTYDGFNQLKSTISDNKTSTYTYNSDGLRTSKTVDGIVTNHIWDGQDIVGEINGTGEVTSKYIRGINLIALKDNSDVASKYYLFNAHGDVVQLTDSTGNVVMDYIYDAFGNRKVMYGDLNGDSKVTSTDLAYINRYNIGMITDFPIKTGFIAADVNGDGVVNSVDYSLFEQFTLGQIKYFPADKNKDGFAQDDETHANFSDANVFRYCGEYFDKETSTIYLRARYYNPAIGRFITEDSYWGKANDPLSLNLYTYCHNNPVIFIDPSGHKVTSWDLKNCTEIEIDLLEKYTDQWRIAYLSGITSKMKEAHDKCEAIRNRHRASYEVGTGDGNTEYAKIHSTTITAAPKTDVISFKVSGGTGLEAKLKIAGVGVEIGGKKYYDLSNVASDKPTESMEFSFMAQASNKLQVGSKVTGTIDARTCESLKNEGFAGVKIGDTTFGWNNLPQNEDFSLEFTAGGYLGVGGEVSVNINLSELWRRVVKFFGD